MMDLSPLCPSLYICPPSRRIFTKVQAEGEIEGARRILGLHQVLPFHPRASRRYGHPVPHRQRELREKLLHTGEGDFE